MSGKSGIVHGTCAQAVVISFESGSSSDWISIVKVVLTAEKRPACVPLGSLHEDQATHT